MSAERKEPTAIPVGSQFTPNVIDLPSFIQTAVRSSGDFDEILQAVWHRPVNIRDEVGVPEGSRRRARLPLEAAVQYGLLARDSYEATQLAHELEGVEDESELYDRFARHILLRCGGIRVLEAIEQMRLDGQKPTAEAIAEYLSEQGFNIAQSNTALNAMRLWLAQAGVFPEGHPYWTIDHGKKEELIGLSDDDIVEIASLTAEQRQFLAALCRRDPDRWVPANSIRDLAEVKSGVRFGRKGFVRRILRPLAEQGFVEVETGGTASGKTSRVRPSERFDTEVLTSFLEHAIDYLNPTLTAYYRERPDDIFRGLESEDRNEKGEALEAFAVLVMRLLGLRFVAWRKRAPDTTGQSEVDVLMAGLLGGIPTRWQVQCKNTPSSVVGVETVAKEIGLMPITKATHVMLICNCRITDDARHYARQIMNESHVSIFLLDREDFNELEEEPSSLGPILRAKGERMSKSPPQSRLWRE